MDLTVGEMEDRFEALLGSGRGGGVARSNDTFSPVERVLRDILERGGFAFHPKHLATSAGISLAEAQKVLERWVKDSRLIRHFEVLCPESGRTVRSYRMASAVPVGEDLDCPYCEDPHLVAESDLWVTYSAPSL
jgi:predicted GH43/DUF377 family glycosyl hydrolase